MSQFSGANMYLFAVVYAEHTTHTIWINIFKALVIPGLSLIWSMTKNTDARGNITQATWMGKIITIPQAFGQENMQGRVVNWVYLNQ